MRHMLAWVTVEIPVSHDDDAPRRLVLKRTPKYLRFTVEGKTVDALDQLDDTPRPTERIFAAVKDDAEGSMHLDRFVGGRRTGEWYRTVNYTLVPNQPADEILRDSAKWQEWCYSQPGAPPRP